MTIEELVRKREFIYHLTSSQNLELIVRSGEILSTNSLVNNSGLDVGIRQSITRERRPNHVHIESNGEAVMIRDQRPISLKALAKCLPYGLSTSDFIEHLNARVFFWPTIKRLNIHFERYQAEAPSIIRVRTKDVVEENLGRLRLCRLNSGATRCSSHHNGAPPPRGLDTFKKVEDYPLAISSIAEVTFEQKCVLPKELWIGQTPDGPWRGVDLE